MTLGFPLQFGKERAKRSLSGYDWVLCLLDFCFLRKCLYYPHDCTCDCRNERFTSCRTLRISAPRKRVPLKPPRCDSKSGQEPGLATHTCHLSPWQEDCPKCEVSLRNTVSSRPAWACVTSYLPKKDGWGNGSIGKVLAVQAQGLGFGSSVLM